MTDVAGVPVIVGAEFGGGEVGGGVLAAALTAIENAGSWAVASRRLRRLRCCWTVPTLAAAGVPSNRPVVVLNVAHAGRFVMLKVSESPFGSLAVG